MYPADDIPLPVRREGEEHWQEMIALTYGMITHVDDEIGRIVDALERTGELEDTLIVSLGDHGDMMGDHGPVWKGPYTFRGCIEIPAIACAPGATQGAVSEALISQIDLMPPVLDYCGVPMPGDEWRAVETPFERGSV
jgi:arylsulfatase